MLDTVDSIEWWTPLNVVRVSTAFVFINSGYPRTLPRSRVLRKEFVDHFIRVGIRRMLASVCHCDSIGKPE